MSDHDFCRTLLVIVMKEVRCHTTSAQRKAAWSYRYNGTDSAEFHGPGGYYWHGCADCLWDARVQGWQEWMAKQGVKEYQRTEEVT